MLNTESFQFLPLSFADTKADLEGGGAYFQS